MAMNLELARQNMIEQQVRPWAVLDADVLNVLARVPREDFVPAAYRQLAFADLALPIGHGQVMLKPVIEGRLLQALALQPHESVLEIGTGSGFLTACLAALVPAGKVLSLDIEPDFIAQAAPKLLSAGFRHVELLAADAFGDSLPQQSFDAIVLSGASARIPQDFLHWLKPGGRLFVIHGQSPAQKAVLLTRGQGSEIREDELFETDVPYLTHAEPSRQFVF
ncbi:protein-L-isoaspartate O-methyltransferase family protein [Frateuria aurantia]|uniref:Protein-L-isoaspartate O-methyltransferase n=1 Tax=Frateuria aurantia (strain ATCC 33424 / DSM 6220 / KCTC 2777 / LMG 1558 / NBRC 3245 / NCIMB 13370) TaxID=767434 RepID=H8L4E5_FRAAD|nr:protein-L-isoaspartate O-methyltransferase [Frateuria aurantia]AFC84978.1 protein-L-isoaspartate carboxylmethyltransferase [Frateuria aurantia DSM 6220]